MSTAAVATVLAEFRRREWVRDHGWWAFFGAVATCAALAYADAQLPVWVDLRKIIDTEEIIAC